MDHPAMGTPMTMETTTLFSLDFPVKPMAAHELKPQVVVLHPFQEEQIQYIATPKKIQKLNPTKKWQITVLSLFGVTRGQPVLDFIIFFSPGDPQGVPGKAAIALPGRRQ